METGSIVVQLPAGAARQLFLLFHGVGGTPGDLVAMGQLLAQAFPNALVVSVQAPHPGPSGRGFQWFSVERVSEENRPERVAQAMPAFLEAVAHWQSQGGVDAQATALVGFSQGAIMALESTKTARARAGRVVALGGRFARLPEEPAPDTTIHLFHGKEDRVMPFGHAVAAAERLLALGTDVTADVLPFTGHEVSAPMAQLVLDRLRGYLPQRRWREALAADPGEPVQGSETRQ